MGDSEFTSWDADWARNSPEPNDSEETRDAFMRGLPEAFREALAGGAKGSAGVVIDEEALRDEIEGLRNRREHRYGMDDVGAPEAGVDDEPLFSASLRSLKSVLKMLIAFMCLLCS